MLESPVYWVRCKWWIHELSDCSCYEHSHALPDNVSFEAGALTEPLACVVHGVLNSRCVNPGDVAVIAGPGAIGLLTLQVVKAAGATVIMLGTDVDTNRLELAKSLGADYTINIQQQSAEELVRDLTQEGLGVDVVYECSGAGRGSSAIIDSRPTTGTLCPDWLVW